MLGADVLHAGVLEDQLSDGGTEFGRLVAIDGDIRDHAGDH